MRFEMEWKMDGLLGLVRDGKQNEQLIDDRHKWSETVRSKYKYLPQGIVSVSFTHPDLYCNLFLGPNLSRQPFPTTQTIKPQQGQQQFMIYTDFVTQSVVGNQQKGSLRTIDVNNTEHHFDATQLVYSPLRILSYRY